MAVCFSGHSAYTRQGGQHKRHYCRRGRSLYLLGSYALFRYRTRTVLFVLNFRKGSPFEILKFDSVMLWKKFFDVVGVRSPICRLRICHFFVLKCERIHNTEWSFEMRLLPIVCCCYYCCRILEESEIESDAFLLEEIFDIERFVLFCSQVERSPLSSAGEESGDESGSEAESPGQRQRSPSPEPSNSTRYHFSK